LVLSNGGIKVKDVELSQDQCEFIIVSLAQCHHHARESFVFETDKHELGGYGVLVPTWAQVFLSLVILEEKEEADSIGMLLVSFWRIND